ncbi:MAG: succinylglutamate desuccinylase/aspartoacylase family protein, partial [Desulfobacterales bacterium]
EVNSNRVKVDVIGQSAGGRNLFLVTVSAPEAMGRLGQYQAIRNTMLKDPEKAQEMIDKFGDFKVPVFVNGSIHGNEYEGVDACIRLIETLAFGDSEEVQTILNNVILLLNVVQNPDGRVMGIRRNAKNVDLNRDFITQTQPETRATVKVITEWNPMVFLDLHDDVQPMLIEPCSPPHNPNYEYDLYIRWALYQAYAMEAELIANTDETEALIPFRDWDFTVEGYTWDDWPPIYTPMYAMYHGAYGHTLETPYEDERGVDADYWAVWGALKFVAANRQAMVRDQVEIFRRGFLDLPQALIPDWILEETPYDQFNDLTIKEFPAAYVIPADGPMQLSSHQPARLVDFLLFNDVQVEKASEAFTLNGAAYPKGTYVVWMDQPKRGLANAILEDGLDVSDIEGIEFYSPPTAWSHPLLWGVTRARMEAKQSIKTSEINRADPPSGSVVSGKADFYAYLPTSLAAFKATNDLLKRGMTLYRAKSNGAFILPANASLVNELANSWALDVFSLSDLPEDAVMMKQQRIAVYGDEGDAIALDELGFDYDEVSRSDLNAGIISGYDVFLNRSLRWSQLNADGQASLTAWFAAGGDYIGLLSRGALFARDAGLITFDSDDEGDADAILNIHYDPTDGIAAGFREDGHAYVLGAMWFTSVPGDVTVSASIAGGDFLVAGYWPDWQSSGANGMPVILNKDSGAQDTALIVIDATFRGHPKNTFRLVGNAIYRGLD